MTFFSHWMKFCFCVQNNSVSFCSLIWLPNLFPPSRRCVLPVIRLKNPTPAPSLPLRPVPACALGFGSVFCPPCLLRCCPPSPLSALGDSTGRGHFRPYSWAQTGCPSVVSLKHHSGPASSRSTFSGTLHFFRPCSLLEEKCSPGFPVLT